MFHLSILSLLVVFGNALSCDEVTIEEAYSYDDVMGCINQFPFREDILTKTISTILGVYDNYVYRDINIDSGPPYNIEVDIVSLLSDIKKNTYDTDYELHAALQVVLNRLKDAHTKYVPPFCYATWGFFLPFSMIAKFNGTMKLYIDTSDNAQISQYDEVYPDLSNLVSSYVGYEIILINGENALTYYLDYVDNINSYSRDRGVRWNDGLKSMLDYSTMHYNAPTQEEMEFQISNGDETITINPKWAAFSSVDISEFDGGFASLCGYDTKRRSMGSNYFGLDLEESLNIILIEQRLKKKKRKIMNKRRILKPDNVGLKDYSNIRAGDTVKCYQSDSDSTVAVLVIESFAPEDTNVFAKNTIDCLSSMKKNSVKKLIVDLRGNGGGYVCLLSWLAKRISKYAPAAFNPMGDMITTDFWEKYYCPANQPNYQFLTEERKPATDKEWMKGETHERGGIDNQYTKPFGLDCNIFDAVQFSNVDGYNEDDLFKPEPENLILLTEGKCGSACGMFVSFFQQLNLAKIISQGGIVGEQLALSSFKGASVLNTRSVLDDNNFVFISCPDVKGKIPKFPALQMMTWSWYEVYPYDEISINELNKVSKEIPMEFIKFEGDANIENWNFDPEDTEIYDLTKVYFNTCFDREIKRDDSCSQEFENSISGYQCVNGEFVEGCVLEGCDAGFYMNEEKTECLENAKEYDMFTYYVNYMINLLFVTFVLPAMLIIGIPCCLCCCACCIGYIIGIICCVACVKKRNAQFKDTDQDENVKNVEQNVVGGQNSELIEVDTSKEMEEARVNQDNVSLEVETSESNDFVIKQNTDETKTQVEL